MLKRTFLSAILVFTYSILVAQNTVAIYTDCNYSGRRSNLGPGQYRLYQMQMDNDALSSMKVPYGFRVTLYEHDEFKGQSISFTSNVYCLGSGWNDNTSSMVVEDLNANATNPYNTNDYVTFYSDCYNKGLAASLKPGTYYGNQLGQLLYNISSFAVYGNLRVRVYTNEQATGYSQNFQASETCLSSSLNDRIGSVIIEYTDQYSNNPYNPNTNYATVYTDCNYRGSSMRLAPGYYQGDKLGLFRYDISSIEIPSNLRAKVFVNNETLNGYSYNLTENSNCLSNTLNNRIGSVIIEEKTDYNNNPYTNNNNNNPYNNPNNDQRVVIYSDANYRGSSIALLPGTYASMSQIGFHDNALSSLQLPAGYRVVLYEHENFGGRSYEIVQSKPGFLLSGWNDRTSSIAVYRQ